MPALTRDGWRPGRGRCWRLPQAVGRPWRAGGWPAITDGTAVLGKGAALLACAAAFLAGCPGLLSDGTGSLGVNPPRRYRAVMLARWAHQPAQVISRPARGDRPGPVVRLPERGRVRESHLAPRHGAPGGRNPDLVTDHRLPGYRNRMSERIKIS